MADFFSLKKFHRSSSSSSSSLPSMMMMMSNSPGASSFPENPFSTLGLVLKGRTVISVLRGSSAAEDGRIVCGDVVAAVDGREVVTETAAAAALRGPIGTTVILTIVRPNGQRFSVQLDRRALTVPHDCEDNSSVMMSSSLAMLWDGKHGSQSKEDGNAVWASNPGLDTLPSSVASELRDAHAQLAALTTALSQRDMEISTGRLQIQKLSAIVRELEEKEQVSMMSSQKQDDVMKNLLDAERREKELLRFRLEELEQRQEDQSNMTTTILPHLEDAASLLTTCRERLVASCEELPSLLGQLQYSLSELEAQAGSDGPESSVASAASTLPRRANNLSDPLGNCIRLKRSELDTLAADVHGIVSCMSVPSQLSNRSYVSISSSSSSFRTQPLKDRSSPSTHLIAKCLDKVLTLSEESSLLSRGLSASRRLSQIQREIQEMQSKYVSKTFSNDEKLYGKLMGLRQVLESLKNQHSVLKTMAEHRNVAFGSKTANASMLDNISGMSSGRSEPEMKDVIERLANQLEHHIEEHGKACPASVTDIRVGVSAMKLAALSNYGSDNNNSNQMNPLSATMGQLTNECEHLITTAIQQLSLSLHSTKHHSTDIEPSTTASGTYYLAAIPPMKPTTTTESLRSLEQKILALEDELLSVNHNRIKAEEHISLLESELAKQSSKFKEEKSKLLLQVQSLEEHGPSGLHSFSRSLDITADTSPIQNSIVSPRTRTLRYLDRLGSDEGTQVKQLQSQLEILHRELQQEREDRQRVEVDVKNATDKYETEAARRREDSERLESSLKDSQDKLAAERMKCAALEAELRGEVERGNKDRIQLNALITENKAEKRRWKEESSILEERIKKLEMWLSEEQEKAAMGLMRSKTLETELIAERSLTSTLKLRDGKRLQDLEEMLFDTKESAEKAQVASVVREAKLTVDKKEASAAAAASLQQAQATIQRYEQTIANLRERSGFLEQQLGASRGWLTEDNNRSSDEITQITDSQIQTLQLQLRNSEQRVMDLEQANAELKQHVTSALENHNNSNSKMEHLTAALSTTETQLQKARGGLEALDIFWKDLIGELEATALDIGNDADKHQVLDTIRRQKSDLADANYELKLKQAVIANLERELEAEKKSTERLKTAERDMNKRIATEEQHVMEARTEIATQQQLLHQLEKDKVQLESRVHALQEIMDQERHNFESEKQRFEKENRILEEEVKRTTASADASKQELLQTEHTRHSSQEEIKRLQKALEASEGKLCQSEENLEIVRLKAQAEMSELKKEVLKVRDDKEKIILLESLIKDMEESKETLKQEADEATGQLSEVKSEFARTKSSHLAALRHIEEITSLYEAALTTIQQLEEKVEKNGGDGASMKITEHERQMEQLQVQMNDAQARATLLIDEYVTEKERAETLETDNHRLELELSLLQDASSKMQKLMQEKEREWNEYISQVDVELKSKDEEIAELDMQLVISKGKLEETESKLSLLEDEYVARGQAHT